MDNFEMSCCSLGFLDSCHFEFACGARRILDHFGRKAYQEE